MYADAMVDSEEKRKEAKLGWMAAATATASSSAGPTAILALAVRIACARCANTLGRETDSFLRGASSTSLPSGRRRPSCAHFCLRCAKLSVVAAIGTIVLLKLFGPACRFAYVSNPITNQYDKYYDERYVPRRPLRCRDVRTPYAVVTFVTSDLERAGLRAKLGSIYAQYERLHPDTSVHIVNPYEFVECDGPKTAIFKKHCVARVMLEKNCADALMVLDADAVPINFSRHFKEWIDEDNDRRRARLLPPRDLYFNRRPNNEVCACGYVARNTEFARRFLRRWEGGFDAMPCSTMGYDQGTLSELLFEHFTRELPDKEEALRDFKRMRGRVFGNYMYLVDFANRLMEQISGSFDRDENIRIFNENEGFVQEKSGLLVPSDGYIEHHHWSTCDYDPRCKGS